MKTTTWQPASSHHSDKLGISQRFAITAKGDKSLEVGAIGVLYLTIAYIRTNMEFSVTTLEGVEVAHNRGGGLYGENDFIEALYLMDQALITERKRAINDTLDDLAERAGLNQASNDSDDIALVTGLLQPQPAAQSEQGDATGVPGLRNPRNQRNPRNRN